MPQVRRAGQLVFKGKDRWMIRYSLGRNHASGKWIYQSETVRGTKSAAQAVLNRRLTSVNDRQLVKKVALSLEEYLETWLNTVVRARVRESTFHSYEYHLKHYLFGRLGKVKLTKLDGLQVQEFCNDLRERYSSRTVQYVHTILKNALKKAVETRLIAENPCIYVELPKKTKREIKVFSPDEARKFLQAAERDPRGLVFEFALLMGARPEEYLGLKWCDVDFERRTVTFQRTLIWRKGGGWYLDEEMKTNRSRRTIRLPVVLNSKLQTHRKKQVESMLLLGPEYQRNEFVFASDLGGPLHYGNMTKRHFQPILKTAGLGHYRLYSLRHSCATLLLAQGENMKVIQERLGHADVVLTLSTYSHVLEGMQAQASDRLGSLLYTEKVGFAGPK